ncbi:4'-phosphopantetheinyl transferase family protein [Streptomyces sp. ALB3]|uniref:4'-phosphopantetheinyl transferase family protein n=1 Tax=Streptomyces sp. ALB3 TaxID=3374278 RepID=UPI00379A3D4D
MTPIPVTGPVPAPVRGAGTSRTTAECHIWSLPPLSRPSSWFGLLDSTELSRCSSFAHELDLARFVTGRMLAKTALASLVGTGPESIRLHTRCPDCGGPHGKPRVVVGPGAGWELSISHSGGTVAVAVAQGSPLGLDVEQEEPWHGDGLPPEYELVLTPAERSAVEALPQHRRARACLTYWTRKEALLKATGEGLNRPMTDFTLSAPDEPPALLAWHTRERDRPVPALADVRLAEDCHGAVAVLGVRTVLPRVHNSADLLPAGRPAVRRPPPERIHVVSTERPLSGATGHARAPAERLP